MSPRGDRFAVKGVPLRVPPGPCSSPVVMALPLSTRCGGLGALSSHPGGASASVLAEEAAPRLRPHCQGNAPPAGTAHRSAPPNFAEDQTTVPLGSARRPRRERRPPRLGSRHPRVCLTLSSARALRPQGHHSGVPALRPSRPGMNTARSQEAFDSPWPVRSGVGLPRSLTRVCCHPRGASRRALGCPVSAGSRWSHWCGFRGGWHESCTGHRDSTQTLPSGTRSLQLTGRGGDLGMCQGSRGVPTVGPRLPQPLRGAQAVPLSCPPPLVPRRPPRTEDPSSTSGRPGRAQGCGCQALRPDQAGAEPGSHGSSWP